MRKDVKLGLAVGGVLLAVLVVYVLVVPGNNANQVGATLEPVGSEAQTGGTAAGESVAQGESTTPPADSTGESAQDQQAKGVGATADAGGANGASGAGAGAGGASAGDTSAGANGAAGGANTGASAKDNATAGGGWNWDALVNGTEKLPSMGAATDVSTNNASFTNAGGNQAGNGAAGNGGHLPTNTPANGTSTANGTAGQNGTVRGSLAQGGTAQGGADVLSNGTPGGAGQSPSRQATLAEPTSPRAQDGAAAPMTVATDSATRTHVVKVGDTYSKISLAVYGTSKHYADIELANPGVDPTRLKPGTTINLPAVAAKQPTATPAVNGASATIDPQKEYKVQPNDSLYTISLRLYGKADRMEKIYELNKSAIGDDMARLKLGMVLKLPEPPTQTTAAAQAR